MEPGTSRRRIYVNHSTTIFGYLLWNDRHFINESVLFMKGNVVLADWLISLNCWVFMSSETIESYTYPLYRSCCDPTECSWSLLTHCSTYGGTVWLPPQIFDSFPRFYIGGIFFRSRGKIYVISLILSAALIKASHFCERCARAFLFSPPSVRNLNLPSLHLCLFLLGFVCRLLYPFYGMVSISDHTAIYFIQ
jgi:hypothetical protein